VRLLERSAGHVGHLIDHADLGAAPSPVLAVRAPGVVADSLL
jgi:hypothetical protein